MEEEIIETIRNLAVLMGKAEMIAIIYNPYKEGLEPKDMISLKSLMNNNVYNSPLFLLSGHGGSFNAGVHFPHIIKQSVKTYKVYIPSVCASALGFMLFLSDGLVISRKSKITQLDPLVIQEDGQVLRAVDYMNNLVKDEIRNKSKEAFNATRDQLVKFCEESKLFSFKTWERGDYYFREYLEVIFMKKEDHDRAVTKKELDELEVKYELIDSQDIEKVSFDLIRLCRKHLEENDARVIFVSSKSFKIGTEEGLKKGCGIFVS